LAKTAFCLDENDNLYTASLKDARWMLVVVNSVTGKISEKQLKGLSMNAMPNLWGFSAGKIVFSAWAGGPTGQFVGSIVPASGKNETYVSLGEVPAMVRYLSVDIDGNVWRAVEQYSGVSKLMRIIKLDLAGDAEG